MSKYNLTDILNEYIGGGRIGTLKISYKDLVDKMDELEKSGKVIVREKGSSADGKVNREFEVVDRDSAVPGGRKQERGFTVYDYKFGFDPGSEEHFMEEYDFSVGGNDLQLAMDLIDGVKAYGIDDFPNLKENIPPSRDDKIMKDLAKADEVIKMIKMMNPDVREDLLIRIARMGQGMDESINEGDLFSSKYDRSELMDIINDLNKGLILDIPTRRAYKFLVSLLDDNDKKELGLYDVFGEKDKEPRDGVKSAAAKLGIKPSHVKQENMDKLKQKAVEDELPRVKEILKKFGFNPVPKDEDIREFLNLDKMLDAIKDADDDEVFEEYEEFDRGRKQGYGAMEEVMGIDRKGRKKSDTKSNLTGGAVTTMKESSQEESLADYLIKSYTNPNTGKSMVDDKMVSDFMRTVPEWEDIFDGSEEGNDSIDKEFEDFLFLNYDSLDEVKERKEMKQLREHFNRFK